jgi:SnoaL-like polyketide cyclase
MGVINNGKAEVANFYTLVFSTFPDFKIELTSHFVAGNWAGDEWLMSGTHQGDLPGLPATKKHFSIRGASVFGLQGTIFSRCSDY